MQQKDDKHIKIVLLIVITLVILGLFLVFYVSGKKQEILNKLNEMRRGGEMTAAQVQKDKEAQEMGWDRSIDGEVVSFSGNMLVIKSATKASDDVEYRITLNENTEFYQEKTMTVKGDEGEEIQTTLAKPLPAEYSDMKVGQIVGVYFAQRVDVDNAEQLIATEIVIYPTN